MINILGIFASIILVMSSLPQVILCLKQGHAKGVSAGMLWLWLIGMILMGIYIVSTRGGDLILFCNYSVNICMILVIMKFKYFPRKPTNDVIYKSEDNV